MISSLKIRRFKRFRSLDLSIGDLTVLTGLNGAGKTSIIHALLLFRHAAIGTVHGIALNGPSDLSLGEALDVLHRGAFGDTIELVVEYAEDETPSVLVLEIPDERALNLPVRQRPRREPAQGITAHPPWFTYLCAERLGPRDTLQADSSDIQTLGVGVRGEYTAQVLARYEREPVRVARLAPTGEEQIGALAQLRRQTERWMSIILGLDGLMEVDAEWFPGTTVTRVSYSMPGQAGGRTRPPNMGFGVSYVLPIVVAALRTPPGGLIIVENPEAHLHPAGQSAMGEFLARVAADGVQVVVETHSDHVVNGVRRAVCEGKARLPVERVALHFFGGSGPSGDDVTTIGLRTSGDLSIWPRGFFDQIERDLGAIARARRGKRA